MEALTSTRGDTFKVSKVYSSLVGYDTSVAFTVTGDVRVRVVGVVGTAITISGASNTLSIGTTELVNSIIGTSTVDNSQFGATDVWVDTNPGADSGRMTQDWVIIGGGADIILERGVMDDFDGGSLTLYCEWEPLSSDGNVVAA